MEPIDQSEPLDDHVQPAGEIVVGDNDDYGGPEVAEAEELFGGLAASDDYESSNHQTVERLSTDSTHEPKDYSDYYTS